MNSSDLDKLEMIRLTFEAERELYYKNILLRKWAIIDIFIGQNKKKEVIVRMNRYCFPLQLPGDEKEAKQNGRFSSYDR